MKKNLRILIVLACLLVVCAGVFLGVSSYQKKQADALLKQQEADIIYVGGISGVVELFYDNGEEQLTFKKEGNSWTYAPDPEFPLVTSSIYSITNALEGLTATRAISASESLSSYGLDKPSRTITAVSSTGETQTIYIGSKVNYDYYAMLEGDDTIYVISSTLWEYSGYNLMDVIKSETTTELSEMSTSSFAVHHNGNFLEIDMLSFEDGEVIQVTNQETGELEDYVIEKTLTRWMVTHNDYYNDAISMTMDLPENDEYAATGMPALMYYIDLLTSFNELSIDSAAAYKPTTEELASFGLDETASTLTMAAMDTNGSTFVIYIGDRVEDESGAFYYMQYAGSKQINLVEADAIDTMIETFNKFFPETSDVTDGTDIDNTDGNGEDVAE